MPYRPGPRKSDCQGRDRPSSNRHHAVNCQPITVKRRSSWHWKINTFWPPLFSASCSQPRSAGGMVGIIELIGTPQNPRGPGRPPGQGPLPPQRICLARCSGAGLRHKPPLIAQPPPAHFHGSHKQPSLLWGRTGTPGPYASGFRYDNRSNTRRPYARTQSGNWAG